MNCRVVEGLDDRVGNKESVCALKEKNERGRGYSEVCFMRVVERDGHPVFSKLGDRMRYHLASRHLGHKKPRGTRAPAVRQTSTDEHREDDVDVVLGRQVSRVDRVVAEVLARDELCEELRRFGLLAVLRESQNAAERRPEDSRDKDA